MLEIRCYETSPSSMQTPIQFNFVQQLSCEDSNNPALKLKLQTGFANQLFFKLKENMFKIKLENYREIG